MEIKYASDLPWSKNYILTSRVSHMSWVKSSHVLQLLEIITISEEKWQPHEQVHEARIAAATGGGDRYQQQAQDSELQHQNRVEEPEWQCQNYLVRSCRYLQQSQLVLIAYHTIFLNFIIRNNASYFWDFLTWRFKNKNNLWRMKSMENNTLFSCKMQAKDREPLFYYWYYDEIAEGTSMQGLSNNN